MNDGLFEMIKVAKKYKHRPQILTNGLKLGQEQYVIDLKKSGLNWLGLSMNGGLMKYIKDLIMVSMQN